MALWQVGFFVLPKNCLDAFNSFQLLKDFAFNDAIFWQPEKVKPSFFDPVDKILPKTKSWGDYLILYGDENSNRFEVVFENDIVESVSFRIDFTSDYEKVLIVLIDFFILNGLIVLDESLRILPLNFEVIKNVIESSIQVKKYKGLTGK